MVCSRNGQIPQCDYVFGEEVWTIHNFQTILKLVKPTTAQNDHIERVGRWWETIGSRSAGRILGWLMICDPPHRSAAELAEELQLSTGSVSTQTSTLERIGFLDRVTFPGDRASYYVLKPNVWFDLMKTEMGRLEQLRQLAQSAADVLPTERPDRVTELSQTSEFLIQEWPDLMVRLSRYLETEKSK